MYQTLCYIPENFCGIPVFGWGWALGLFAAALLISVIWQFIKTKKVSDLSNTLFLFIIGGAILVFVVPNIAEPGRGVPIRGYGFCLLVAILSALTLVVHLAKKQNIAAETVYSLCFWTVLSGIVGARIFYVTEYWREMVSIDVTGQLRLIETFFRVVNIAQGGLVVFGSILGGMFGAFVFIRRNKMPMLKTFDAMAPALMLGIAIGRIGCLLNGCCFGGVTDVPWSVVFPEGSPVHLHQIAHNDIFCCGLKFKEEQINSQQILAIAEVQKKSEAETLGLKPNMLLRSITGKLLKQSEQPLDFAVQTRGEASGILAHFLTMNPHEKIRFNVFANSSLTEASPYWITPSSQSVLPVHPTQIYSSCTAFLLCGVLLLLGKINYYRQRSGLVLATFMILYPVARFILELIRTDEDSFFGTGLTVSQNVSIVVLFAGIGLFLHLTQKKSGEP